MGRLPITPDDVTVQVESSRTDVWVRGPGCAEAALHARGITLTYDAATGLARPGLRGGESLQVGGQSGPMTTRKSGGWIQMYPVNWSARSTATATRTVP